MSDVVTACTGSGSWLALVSMLYVGPKGIGPRESSTHAQRRVYVRHDQLRIPKATFGHFEYSWVNDDQNEGRAVSIFHAGIVQPQRSCKDMLLFLQLVDL